MLFTLKRSRLSEDMITSIGYENEIIKEEPKNYTGIPVSLLLREAGIQEEATTSTFIGADGYTVHFSIQEVVENLMILQKTKEGMRLIAGTNYPGALWVRRVDKIEIS